MAENIECTSAVCAHLIRDEGVYKSKAREDN